jgi:hypothetical protein
MRSTLLAVSLIALAGLGVAAAQDRPADPTYRVIQGTAGSPAARAPRPVEDATNPPLE